MAEWTSLIDEPETNFPDNLLKAREQIEAALPGLSGAERGEALADAARASYWLGDFSSEKAEKDKYFGEGVEYGKQAVEAAPDSTAAHLWYASNMGGHALQRGIMQSLFYLGPMEKHGKRALELDESYFDAGPARLLGRFYHQTPGWPIGPGDAKKARQLLERALELAPDFPHNKLYLGELLLGAGEKDRGKALIEELLAAAPPAGRSMLYAAARADAQEVLKKA